jgi:hypothetical protein
MALIIGLTLTLLSILVVVYPFLQSRRQSPTPDPATGGAAAGPDLENIYDSIRTLQLERQLGNIPEGLYQEQLRGYRMQAALALREQAQAEARDEDWTLEEEIRVARAGLQRTGDGSIRCPNCGTPVLSEARQCGECNVTLDPESSGTSAGAGA